MHHVAEDGFTDLTDLDYERIEDALLSSVRGRAFLRLRDRRHRVVALDDVRRLLKEQGRLPEAETGSHIRILRRELQELSSHIAQTRREIAALRPEDPSANRIMLATEELDAILQATEHATTEILGGSERIQAVADRIREGEPEAAGILDHEVMEIMTACSFQDITGQRMTKVVNTLRYIETRVHAMIQIWGVEDADALMGDGPFAPEDADHRPDAHLLNGPALKGGISQDAVDALLAGAALAAHCAPDPLAPERADSPPTAQAPEQPPPARNGHDGGAAPKTAGPALSQSAVDNLFD